MYLDIRHLRSLLAIQETGNLARAAERLHVTPSALSHQIKSLETYLGVPLFLRNKKPLRPAPAGRRLLELARHVIPLLHEAENDLKRAAKGETGRLHIAIECHACFDWLLPVLDKFRLQWPDVEVDIRLGLSFEPIPALQGGEVDLVITSDKLDRADLCFEPLFDYQAVLVMAADHPLREKPFIQPQDLRDQTLLTYPVARRRLDVFSRFLQPAAVEPLAVRQVELTAVILLLAASQRGVAVLPDWVVEAAGRHSLCTRPLGPQGFHGTLFAALRQPDRALQYVTDFIALTRAFRA